MTSVRCSGGCGAEASNEESALMQGWSYLPISNRYRCGGCTKVLLEARRLYPSVRPTTNGDES